MKGSTALLTILGISFLLIGAGFVFSLPSQTFFPDTYPAKLPTSGLFSFTYPVGDYFIMYVPPGSDIPQFVQYPLTSLNYFGGFLASNIPVNVSVFGVSGFLSGTPLVEVDNTLIATYFTGLYSNPLAFGGVILDVANSGSEPAIVIGQSRQYTVSLYSNPMVGLGYALMMLGVLFTLVGIAGEKVESKPLGYIPSSAGETVSTGFRIWRRIFASTIIPYGLIYSVYELLDILGLAYSRAAYPILTSSEYLAIEYGLMFIGIFFVVVVTGIVIKATSDIIEGKRSSLAQNLKHVFRLSGKMYLAYFVFSIIVGFGFILFIIPGIYLAIIFSLVLPAIVITDNGPMESFGTSKMLTQDNKLRTFGVLLAAVLIVLILETPLIFIAFYFFAQTYLGFGILQMGVSITSQLLGFNLPQILGFVILGSIIIASISIISPIIITTWFYSLGGAYEKARDMYVPTKPEEGVVCSNCKRAILKESKFCPYCGKKQKPSKTPTNRNP